MQLTSWRALWSGGAITAISPCLPWYSIPSRQSRQRAGRHAGCLHSKVKEDKCSAKNGKVHEVKVAHSHAVKVLNKFASRHFWCCGVLQSAVLLYYTYDHTTHSSHSTVFLPSGYLTIYIHTIVAISVYARCAPT